MKKNIQWYTLLEIIITLWVIIALLAITMNFSTNRIEDLDIQATKEDFMHSYESIIINNMSSNYLNQKRYTSLDIEINSWSNKIVYKINDEWWIIETYVWFSSDKLIINNIKSNDQYKENIHIILQPYTLWCQILANEESITDAKIEIKTRKSLDCFAIQNQTCKLKKISCE